MPSSVRKRSKRSRSRSRSPKRSRSSSRESKQTWRVTKSILPTKRFTATRLEDGKKVHFGHPTMSNYTKHHEAKRKKSYLARHGSPNARENWSKSGITSAGFWSRWLLWNIDDLHASAKDMERRFNIKVILSGVYNRSRSRSRSRSR